MPKDNLSGKKLDHVNLSGTNLSEADLSNASLRRSQLKGAKLHNANLADSDLRGAHLEHADLTGAHLEHADLSGADLTGVDLRTVASLEGANLTDARGIADQPEVHTDDDRVVSIRWDGDQSAHLSVDRLLASVVDLNGQIADSVRAVSTQHKHLAGNDRRDAIAAITHLRQRRDELEARLVRAFAEGSHERQ
jgi:uncharacterized protein YjbI with pentapeptide repeats